jgi:CubicO group peptidase (beta-lactamase class C family)
MNAHVLTNSNLIESNILKFDTYANIFPTYSHLAGTISGGSKIKNVPGILDTFAQITTLNWGQGSNVGNSYFQFGNLTTSNLLLHRNFTNGYILPPFLKTAIYEPDLTKHEYSNGYFITANTQNWYSPMVVKKADSSNLNANLRISSWSVSKAFGTMVMMALYDKGYVKSLDDKISNYFSNVPSVGNNRLKVYEKDAIRTRIARQDITVRHILSDTHGLISKSALGDGCSVPIRMTSDKKTYDISDFVIASNVGIAANNYSANLFVYKDVLYAGATFLFKEEKANLGNGLDLLSRVADFVQTWFDEQASNPMYLTADPGEVGVYSAATQITVGLMEKIYEKATGNSNTFGQIFTELILAPIGLTEDDCSFWQTQKNAANTFMDTFGTTSLGNMTGSAFTEDLNGYAKETADYLTQPPLIGPLRSIPNSLGSTGCSVAYYKDGSRSLPLLETIRAFGAFGALGLTGALIPGSDAQLSAPNGEAFLSNVVAANFGAAGALASFYPDLTANVIDDGPLKFYDINSGWSATMDTYAKIFSIISNNGYYIKAGQAPVKVISGSVINAFFKREDGRNETVWPTLGQPIDITISDASGFFSSGTDRPNRNVVTAYGRIKGSGDTGRLDKRVLLPVEHGCDRSCQYFLGTVVYPA